MWGRFSVTGSPLLLNWSASLEATRTSRSDGSGALWEKGLINRWAFPGIRTHSEFHYYLDSREPLNILAERRGLQIHPQMLEEIKSNREKDYAQAAFRQHMQLGFLAHSLMISRLHFMLDTACRNSARQVCLEAWCQGGQLAGRKVEVPKVKSSRGGTSYFWEEAAESERLPVEPDGMFTLRLMDRPAGGQLVHFFYEADRGTMIMTDMLKELRGYYHLIKKQQKHKEAFGIHPIRAVLVETTNEARAKRLMELVNHPLVCGPAKRAGLFWFPITPQFIDAAAGSPLPGHLEHPAIILDPIWAMPDRTMHALSDAENSPQSAAAKTAKA